MLRLLEMTYADLVDAFRTRYGMGDFLAAALYREFYKRMNPEAMQAPEIQKSPRLTDRLLNDLVFQPGAVVEKQEQPGIVKFVTRLEDGLRIESVILKMERHVTVCLSCQAGCRMGCRFCETGRQGLIRNLRVEEIVGQAYTARRQFGADVRNVVFMGMGEPLDNFDNVLKAVQVLSDQRAMDIAQKHITLSTVGLIDGIQRLGESGLRQIKLAVSLNAPNDSLRAHLMPIHSSASLDRLQQALQAYPWHKNNRPMVAYVLIPGLNDSEACARQLAEWVRPLNAKVNLIAYNPGATDRYRSPDPTEIDSFRRHLIAAEINVQTRASRGRNVMAACGQLSGKQIPLPTGT